MNAVDEMEAVPSSSTEECERDNKQENAEPEEEVCRICRMEGTASSQLYHPCACSGSIKFVHEECLLQWLRHSSSPRCEVCKHEFVFTPIYAEDVPTQLSAQDFMLGLSARASFAISFSCRLLVVLLVWQVVPLITCWLWRLCFVRKFSQVHRVIENRLSLQLLATDCMYGLVLSAVFVFIFFAAISLREMYLHQIFEGEGDVQNEIGLALPPEQPPPQEPVERVQVPVPNWADEVESEDDLPELNAAGEQGLDVAGAGTASLTDGARDDPESRPAHPGQNQQQQGDVAHPGQNQQRQGDAAQPGQNQQRQGDA
eukprot:gene16843-20011_t